MVMINMKNIDSDPSLESAIKWIKESNIQNKCGGFHAWYDCEKKIHSFLYPEITGYAIRLFVQLYKETMDPEMIDRAISAADWLLKIQTSNGGYYCRYYLDNNYQVEYIDKTQYVFDSGIIVTGLLELYESTHDDKYLESALFTADWMLSLQNDDYSINAGILPDGRIIEEPHWSKTRGCHQIKTIISQFVANKSTGNRHKLSSIFISGRDLINSCTETGIFEACRSANLSSSIDLNHPHFDGLEYSA